MSTFIATALQGETLDALVWRVLGGGSGMVEDVLELNRDIAGNAAACSPVLVEGQSVILPLVTATPVADRAMIQLWS